MANEEHLNILEQGVEVWNKWRDTYPNAIPDLTGVNLKGKFLENINFINVDLLEANLSGANLNETNLSRANIQGSNLSGARLRYANLSYANLSYANLAGADLRETNLSEANLSGANFSRAKLVNVNCNGVHLFYTVFGYVNLSQVKGLETVRHDGPSTIGIDTVYLSGGNIPDVFLRGAGVPDTLITLMKSLTGQAFEFYSCFVSHSSKDVEFAERLFADLQSNGVRCWYAPHHMEIGAPILNEIDSAIRLHDKLLLILSENSVDSRWVEHEVLSATTKEYQQERDTRTLFPIRLDNAVMETNVQWARTLKDTRHIADFTQWKDHDSYRKAFDRLLRDLKGKS